MEHECVSFDTFGEMLDDIMLTLPKELFVKLNGGVNLLPDVLTHSDCESLYILGQYHQGGLLGRYITINYGSFMKLYGRRSLSFIREQIGKVLRHELLHHLESLAGERELEIKDAIEIAKYKFENKMAKRRRIDNDCL